MRPRRPPDPEEYPEMARFRPYGVIQTMPGFVFFLFFCIMLASFYHRVRANWRNEQRIQAAVLRARERIRRRNENPEEERPVRIIPFRRIREDPIEARHRYLIEHFRRRAINGYERGP